MISNKTFGIIGGDMRQIHLAKKLICDGNTVLMHGFENVEDLDCLTSKNKNLENVIQNSKYLILPVPVSRDRKKLNAPFSKNTIQINKKFVAPLKNKVVFGGIISPLLEYVNKPSEFCIKDYYEREDFLIYNAALTAEGSIKTMVQNMSIPISGSKCLVAGYGRIGKILSKLLKNLGAKVTVSARNLKDTSLAETNGFEVINVKEINENHYFDVIFNTVPAIIFDFEVLKFLKSTKLIIDLASLPGGVDKNSADKFNIKIINDLGIPGRYYPEPSGEILAKVIYKIIKEEHL